MSIKVYHPSFMSHNAFFFDSPHTALSLFWPSDIDMHEVIRVNMAKGVQIWSKQERIEYKNAKSIKKSKVVIIILHLYNLRIPGLYASIYNIKNNINIKYTHFH